ncbi:MAG: hypothetical protein LBE18_11540, partial [Planctomycetaceae bacterium]|nr:hypothetical protein [Planctomycetaceae bacterium]
TKKYFSRRERRRPACIFFVQKTPKDAVETTALPRTINYSADILLLLTINLITYKLLLSDESLGSISSSWG